jgi:aquaporin Z
VELSGAVRLIQQIFIQFSFFPKMFMVLLVSNQSKLNRWTGAFAGCLVWLYIIIEAPLSGFGMNPARSFASALPASIWTAFWLYLIAVKVLGL